MLVSLWFTFSLLCVVVLICGGLVLWWVVLLSWLVWLVLGLILWFACCWIVVVVLGVCGLFGCVVVSLRLGCGLFGVVWAA